MKIGIQTINLAIAHDATTNKYSPLVVGDKTDYYSVFGTLPSNRAITADTTYEHLYIKFFLIVDTTAGANTLTLFGTDITAYIVDNVYYRIDAMYLGSAWRFDITPTTHQNLIFNRTTLFKDAIISNAKLSNMPGFSIKAKVDTGSGVPTDLVIGNNEIVAKVGAAGSVDGLAINASSVPGRLAAGDLVNIPIKDEDDMISDDVGSIATQQSIVAFARQGQVASAMGHIQNIKNIGSYTFQLMSLNNSNTTVEDDVSLSTTVHNITWNNTGLRAGGAKVYCINTDDSNYGIITDTAEFTFSTAATTDGPCSFGQWVYIELNNTQRTIFAKWDSDLETEYRFFIDTDNYLNVEFSDNSAGTVKSVIQRSAVSASGWYFVGFTCESGTAAIVLYVDGVEDTNVTSTIPAGWAGGTESTEDTDTDVTFGCKLSTATPDEFWNNKMSLLFWSSTHAVAPADWLVMYKMTRGYYIK